MENQELIDSILSHISKIDADANEKKKPFLAALQSLGYNVVPQEVSSNFDLVKFKAGAEKMIMDYFIAHSDWLAIPDMRDAFCERFGIKKNEKEIRREMMLKIYTSINRLLKQEKIFQKKAPAKKGGAPGASRAYLYKLNPKHASIVPRNPGKYDTRKTKRKGE